MGRTEAIALSIALAITEDGKQKKPRDLLGSILSLFSTIFSLWQLVLYKIRPADFASLRRNNWAVKDDAYMDSFRPQGEGKGKARKEALTAIGDMGFSGSTFYSTRDQNYLVKSVPRHSEHSFFRDDLLTPYVEYSAQHPRSLLVRITDFLGSSRLCVGRFLRLAPSHHIVMENILYGQDKAPRDASLQWEHWDLKPTSYFYPERDIADGALTSEQTKAQLADEFHDTIRLPRDAARDFFDQLEQDTRLLADHNATDYSLFLVRMRADGVPAEHVVDPARESAEGDMVPREPPSVPPGPPSWRTGVPSADGKHVFRAAILDFFWAKHKLQPMFMTMLITLWNALIWKSGHMSITTEPNEYRERFLKMVRGIVEIEEDRGK